MAEDHRLRQEAEQLNGAGIGDKSEDSCGGGSRGGGCASAGASAQQDKRRCTYAPGSEKPEVDPLAGPRKLLDPYYSDFLIGSDDHRAAPLALEIWKYAAYAH